jgi:hypothetical protein
MLTCLQPPLNGFASSGSGACNARAARRKEWLKRRPGELFGHSGSSFARGEFHLKLLDDGSLLGEHLSQLGLLGHLRLPLDLAVAAARLTHRTGQDQR